MYLYNIHLQRYLIDLLNNINSVKMIGQKIEARYIDKIKLTHLLEILFGGTFTVKVRSGCQVRTRSVLWKLCKLMPYLVQR